ncbi:MAG: sulfatase-like hydrolase/transferase, partial [bacterium]
LQGPHFPGYGAPMEHEDYLSYLKEFGAEKPKIKNAITTGARGNMPGAFLGGLLDGPVETSVPYYLAERAIRMLETVKKNHKDFFLRVDFWGPHLPYVLPEPYFSMYNPGDIAPSPVYDDDLKDKPRIVSDYRKYWGVEEYTWDDWALAVTKYFGYTTLIDEQIGRVINACRDMGLLDDTAVFYTSDHGGAVGSRGLCDKGPFMYDEFYRIPMIAWRPGLFEQGRTDSSFVYHFDLMPTIVDLMGACPPENMDAVSLLPALTGKGQGREDDMIFCEFHGHQAPFEQRMARDSSYKYIYNCSDTDEFYDLENDPHELKNLISNPNHNNTVKIFKKRLLEWMERVGDPLCRYYKMFL